MSFDSSKGVWWYLRAELYLCVLSCYCILAFKWLIDPNIDIMEQILVGLVCIGIMKLVIPNYSVVFNNYIFKRY